MATRVKNRCNQDLMIPLSTDDVMDGIISYGMRIYHRVARNADGSAVRCRMSSRIQTWKTRPGQFRFSVKYGLYTTYSVTDVTIGDWSLQNGEE